MMLKQDINCEEYSEFCGRLTGLERALWEWSRGMPQSRFIHTSLGHEAAAFCVAKALAPDQALWALYYRSHAWLLALGVPLADIIAEIAAECSGTLGGRAGSMHLLLHPNIIDCNSIVGAQIPIAVGAAITNRTRGIPIVCVLGDGATNTGVFYEALNIASLYKAPVLFVVEDNHLAINTSYGQTSIASIEEKFNLFCIPYFSAARVDIDSVFGIAARASEMIVHSPAAICVIGPRVGAHVLSSQDTWIDSSESYHCSTIAKEASSLTYQEALRLLCATRPILKREYNER